MIIVGHLDLGNGLFEAHSLEDDKDSYWFLIGFSASGDFDNLSFRWTVNSENLDYESATYPTNGARYVESNQQFIEAEPVSVTPDENLQIKFFVSNGDIAYEKLFAFIVPRPPQPYPSWTWDGTGWQPPTPYPDGEEFYIWDEETQTWVEEYSEATATPIGGEGDL